MTSLNLGGLDKKLGVSCVSVYLGQFSCCLRANWETRAAHERQLKQAAHVPQESEIDP